MGSPRQRRALAAAAAGQRGRRLRSASAEPLGRHGRRALGARLTLSISLFALLSTGCGGYARSCPWLPFRDAANAALGATRRVGVARGALLRARASRASSRGGCTVVHPYILGMRWLGVGCRGGAQGDQSGMVRLKKSISGSTCSRLMMALSSSTLAGYSAARSWSSWMSVARL